MTLQQTIEAAWENRAEVNLKTTGDVRDAVNAVLADIDAGKLRVAEKGAAGWQVNQWVKQAILLSFRLNDNQIMEGVAGAPFFDKVPLKFQGWGEEQFRAAGFRAVPGSIVRRGSFVDKSVEIGRAHV